MWKDVIVLSLNVISRHLPEGTDLSQDSRCPSQYSNRAPPEFKSEALAVEPALSVVSYNAIRTIFPFRYIVIFHFGEQVESYYQSDFLNSAVFMLRCCIFERS
jgi:hypothetical protein